MRFQLGKAFDFEKGFHLVERWWDFINPASFGISG